MARFMVGLRCWNGFVRLEKRFGFFDAAAGETVYSRPPGVGNRF
jgi:hypothetical protein